MMSVGGLAITIEGTDVRNGRSFRADDHHRPLVMIFMSTHCPCSQAYEGTIKAIAATYSHAAFVTIVAGLGTDGEAIQEYFGRLDWPMPVLWDRDFAWADRLGASRTPHAFVFRGSQDAVYAGGVGSSHSPEGAALPELHLSKALDSLKRKIPIETPRTRVLGCPIARHGAKKGTA